MTKYLPFALIVLFFSIQAAAQEIIFHEDFESYEPAKCILSIGSLSGGLSPCVIPDNIPKLAEQSDVWTTWSDSPGSEEDVYVVRSKAHSGKQSIHFKSENSEGGPQDLLLPFDQKYSQGTMHYFMKMYIPSGSTGYMNVQALETVGAEFEMQLFFQPDGTYRVQTSTIGLSNQSDKFPFDEWFDVRFIIDLDTPTWYIYVAREGGLIYNWGNGSIASVDFYPVPIDGVKSEFWIDDITYEYYPDMTYEHLNLVLSEDEIANTGFLGTRLNSIGTVLNQGGIYDEFSLHSLELEYTYGQDVQTVKYDNINLLPNESMLLAPPDELMFYKNRFRTFSSKITKVNGFRFDSRLSDNSIEKEIRGTYAAEGKAVLVEIGAGTRCNWCPPAMAMQDSLSKEFGDKFVGISAHQNGPMENQDYFSEFDANIESFIDILVDRKISDDRKLMEDYFIEQIARDPMNTFEISADFNSLTRDLDFSVDIIPNEDMSANQKLFVCLVEDNVTGTSYEYSQSNVYAETQSDACGYENLPHLVPFDQMVYNGVVRMKLTKYAGNSVLDGPIRAGTNRQINYSYNIDPEFSLDNMRIVVAMIDGDNGNIATNAYQITVPKALENLKNSEIILEREDNDSNMNIYPNPANDMVVIHCRKAPEETISYDIVNIQGAVLLSEINNSNMTEFNWVVDLTAIPSGIYIVRMNIGTNVITKKLEIMNN